MKTGYLSIETHDEHRGVIRFVLSGRQPDPEPTRHTTRRIRYIARFNDCEAAMMHTHEILKRRLLDPDNHLYRVPMEQAIAAIESLGLNHRRVYLDADFSADTEAQIGALAEQYRERRRRQTAFFETLGYIGVGMLLFNLLFLSLP